LKSSTTAGVPSIMKYSRLIASASRRTTHIRGRSSAGPSTRIGRGGRQLYVLRTMEYVALAMLMAVYIILLYQVTIRPPGNVEGQKYLETETKLFVDFLDGKDITKRCRYVVALGASCISGYRADFGLVAAGSNVPRLRHFQNAMTNGASERRALTLRIRTPWCWNPRRAPNFHHS
jgi:hypothetical protein